MGKKLDEIKKWEDALSGYTEPTKEEWDTILQIVDPEQWERCGYWEESVADTFANDFGDYHVGDVSMNFPGSMHGDACSATVYALPGGTTVITSYASWEMEGPSVAIYHGKDCDEMTSLAWSLIETDADYGEVCDEDEGEEVTEDTNTVTSGGKDLAKKWKAAMRRWR
jgi:hypothetical protein